MNKWTGWGVACVLLGTVTGSGAEGRGVTLGADYTPDFTEVPSRPGRIAPPVVVSGESATQGYQVAPTRQPAMSLAKESGTTRALRQTTHQLTEMTRMRDAAVQRATTTLAALKACQDEHVQQCPASEPVEEPVVTPAPAVVCAEPAQTDSVVMALQTQLETQQTEILRLQLALASAQAQPRTGPVPPPVTPAVTPAEQRGQKEPAEVQAAAEQDTPADTVTVTRPALSDDTVRQSYASGVALAYLVKRDLDTQRSLGLEQLPEGVLAGFVEEFRGQSRMSMDDVQRWVRNNESAVREATHPDGSVATSVPAQTR